MLVQILLAVQVVAAPVQAQLHPDCTDPATRVTCLTRLAGLGELRDSALTGMARETRYWVLGGGYLSPDVLTILHDGGGVVSGSVWLLWTASSNTSPFAQERCGKRWFAQVGSICEARLAEAVDWAMLLERIEAAGVDSLWGMPEVARRMYDDGFEHVLEARRGAAYQRRTLHGPAEGTGDAASREVAIAQILRCAVRRQGNPPCAVPDERPPVDTATVVSAIADHLVEQMRWSPGRKVERPVRLDTTAGPWDRLVVHALRARSPDLAPILSDSVAYYVERIHVSHVEVRQDYAYVRLEGESCDRDGSAGGWGAEHRVTRWRPRLLQYYGAAVSGWDGSCERYRKRKQ